MWDQILKVRALYENRRYRDGSFIVQICDGGRRLP
jgi:hypothetical protein